MDLYLVQHGEAQDERADPERGLTQKGKSEVERTARFAKEAGIGHLEVFHSGKKRARETAEIMEWHLGAKIIATDGLSPLDDPGVWKGRLDSVSKDIMLVGHLPHLNGLAGLLVAGDKDRDMIDFKMGGIVVPQKERGQVARGVGGDAGGGRVNSQGFR